MTSLKHENGITLNKKYFDWHKKYFDFLRAGLSSGSYSSENCENYMRFYTSECKIDHVTTNKPI